jgi:hypothetical protein
VQLRFGEDILSAKAEVSRRTPGKRLFQFANIHLAAFKYSAEPAG